MIKVKAENKNILFSFVGLDFFFNFASGKLYCGKVSLPQKH